MKREAAKKTKSETAVPEPQERYIEVRGGRKTARARVRLFPSLTDITVNGKPYRRYFPIAKHYRVAVAPLEVLQLAGKVGFSVLVKGGGSNAQAVAVRHGIARALVAYNPEFRRQLRAAGFITRDPRMVERKKYGLKKARRAPQWAKR